MAVQAIAYDPVQVNVLFLADPVEAALWVECLFSVYHRRSSRSPDPPQQVGHQGLLRSVPVDSNVPHLLGVRSSPSGICHDQQNRPVYAQVSNRQVQLPVISSVNISYLSAAAPPVEVRNNSWWPGPHGRVSIQFYGAVTWNALPAALRVERDHSQFCAIIKCLP